MAASKRAACLAITMGCFIVGPSALAVPAAAALVCDGLAVTITGTDGDDVIEGTPGPDVIASLDGRDVIRGRGGDDVICAGPGGDVLRGGGGDDRLFGELDQFSGGDDLYGGPGDDYLDGGYEWHYDRVMYRTEPAGIHADLQTGIVTTSRGIDTIFRPSDTAVYGSHFDDVIDGSELGDTMFGMRGSDILNGHAGDDRMIGRAGDDVMNGGEDRDWMSGSRGDDLLESVGDGFDASLDGGPGDDHLVGTNGWDTYLLGGPGDDWIEGYGGSDRMRGGSGDDLLDGGAGGDRGDAGPGEDTCISVEKRIQCEHHTPGAASDTSTASTTDRRMTYQGTRPADPAARVSGSRRS